jgi:hypothetical protein
MSLLLLLETKLIERNVCCSDIDMCTVYVYAKLGVHILSFFLSFTLFVYIMIIYLIPLPTTTTFQLFNFNLI